MADVIRLTPEDLGTLGALEHPPSVIKRLRDHHHRMAQMVAEGRRSGEIASETGMSLSRVSILKSDPAFQQLVEMYRANVTQAWTDSQVAIFHKYERIEENAADLIIDRYEDDPNSISDGEAMRHLELSGRVLGRQVNKSVNVNINGSQPLAERLEEQRLRAERLMEPDDAA
jgi:hypothetical protein